MAPSKMLRFKRRLWAVEVQSWRANGRQVQCPLFATYRAMSSINYWVQTDARNGTVTTYSWDFRESMLEV